MRSGPTQLSAAIVLALSAVLVAPLAGSAAPARASDRATETDAQLDRSTTRRASRPVPRVVGADQPPQVVQPGEWVPIQGRHFRTRRGRLHIGGRRVQVSRAGWSPRLIVYRVPEDLGYGLFPVEVETPAGRVAARPLLVLPPPPRLLDVAHSEQGAPDWCWAAVSEMVLRHYGVASEQCEQASALAAHQTGAQGVDCCGSDAAASVCGAAAPSLAFIQQQLDQTGRLASELAGGPVSFATLVAEIDRGRPLILAYRGAERGHVVLAYGYDATAESVWIHDPLQGSFEVPYADTGRYASDHGELRWADTILGIR